jgi:(heptosyl)LPS beta-1,4-glucosyltransferase
MVMPITATIITWNEQRTLLRCLRTLSWADEILVLDSGSTDDTVKIASGFGAKVYHQQWQGYAAQKNIAASLASNDWIFNVDADERVSTGLANEIRGLSDKPYRAYSVGRVSDFMGQRHRPVHRPPIERLVRLYDRRAASFGATSVHEKVETLEPPGTLAGTLFHEGFRDLADYANRLNGISSLAARDRPGSNSFTLFAKPFARLAWALFRHRLLLDGRRGFILAFMWAHHDLLVEAKRYEQGLPEMHSAFDVRLFDEPSNISRDRTTEKNDGTS